MKKYLVMLLIVAAIALSGCGGDSTSNTFTVGGIVFGLDDGDTLILQLNQGNDLAITSNMAFTFPDGLANGTFYDVTVLTAPDGKTCSVAHNEGTISGASVTNVSVICSIYAYSVGGIVFGLDDGDTLVLQLNLDDDLTITTNSAFTFPTLIADGLFYDVTVLTHPSGKTCSIANNEGTISGANITNVGVKCSEQAYTVGGMVSGLESDDTLIIQLNLDDDLTISADGDYTFPTVLADDSYYHVTTFTVPDYKTCTVINGMGYITDANVTNADIFCANDTVLIGGTVTGIQSGDTIALQVNDADDLSLTADGNFVFSGRLPVGASYNVTVYRNGSATKCSVSNGSGTVPPTNVTDVEVSCGPYERIYVYESFTPQFGHNVGGRPYTTQTCSDTYYLRQLNLGCTNFVALLGYAADNGVLDLPTAYHLPTTASIRLTNETEVGTNWASFIGNKPSTSMKDSEDMPDHTGWSGISSTGGPSVNCNDWSSSSINVEIGAEFSFYHESSASWESADANCSLFSRLFICMCW